MLVCLASFTIYFRRISIANKRGIDCRSVRRANKTSTRWYKKKHCENLSKKERFH